MSVKVHNPFLFHETGGQRTIEVSGKTVIECLKELARRFPKLELFDEQDELQPYFAVWLNGEEVRPDELDRPMREGDELYLLVVIEGG